MERKDKVFAARRHVRRATTYEAHQDSNGYWCIKLHGLKNGDFNRAGLPSVASVSRLAELRVKQQKAVDDIEGLFDDDFGRAMVVIGRVWTLTSQFYSRAAVNFPMTIRSGLSRVGRTSFDWYQAYFADDEDSTTIESVSSGSTATKEPILTCIARIVSVDLTTRKPVPLTDEQVQRFSSQIVPGAVTFPSFSQPDVIPADAFKWRVRVRYDDLDTEFHANQAAYLVYATECAAQAAHERYYSRIVEDVAFYPVKRACGIYLTEALVGDELEVSTWEDADDKMRLHFAICKGLKMIYFAQLDFFDSVLLQSAL